jgi:hypothetical protein
LRYFAIVLERGGGVVMVWMRELRIFELGAELVIFATDLPY